MAKHDSFFKLYNKKVTALQKNYLTKLTILSLILSFSTVLASHKNIQTKYVEPVVITQVKGVNVETLPPDLPDVPILNKNVFFPQVSAQSVFVLDMDSGVALYEKNSNARFLPASTTKMMTGVVALEYYDLQDELVVERFTIDGQKMNLLPGERITVENLLYGLLIHSANDAAEVLARNYVGGRNAFIVQMNIKANELGLVNTNFKNPTGFDDIGHYSTSKDLVIISSYAMKLPFFQETVGIKQKYITDISGEVGHNLRSTNQLLGVVDGVLGVKTGWTENAHENLVTYLERDGRHLMLAVMGSQDRFGETKILIDWVFENYEWTSLPNYSP